MLKYSQLTIMKKLVIANWKMNPASYAEAKKLAKAAGLSAKKHKNVKVVVCPPFPWLTDMSHEKEAGLEYGAQDVFWLDKGAYTGEVSPLMLKNSKVKYVIIGHSERRRLGETGQNINMKLKAALANGLVPILCVGEDAKTHSKGKLSVGKFLATQLREDLRGVDQNMFINKKLIVAYEPIWAISTTPGVKKDTPENATETIFSIKKLVARMFGILLSDITVLYGGSVDSENAYGFLSCPEIGGVLVGGASLRPADFGGVVKIASELS